uniref:Uncharacterized protein n=1 Tax=Homalodisca liturata TaxID=320908 RepID=A0A1B6HUY1_9HEMI
MASSRWCSQPVHKAMLSGDVALLQSVSEKYSIDFLIATKTMYLLSGYAKQNYHITPLQASVMTGNYELCKRLIFEGAEFISLSFHMMHPLNIALDFGKFQIAKLLITSGADVSLNQHGFYPMYYAIKHLTPDYIVEAILKAGFSPDTAVENVYNSTALHRAVTSNNEPVVKLLLKYKANCDITDSCDGYTAMHIAVKQRLPAMVDLLAEYGAQMNVECKEGYTPLFYAIGVNELNCLQALLRHGADIHHFSSIKQCYPLNFAVYLGRKELTEALLKQGADVKKVALRSGNSSLHSAAISHRGKMSEDTMESLLGIVQCLIEVGAEIDLVNKHGYTPMQLAIKEENFRIVKLLVKEGSSVNQTLDHGTNFHFVSKLASKEVVKVFLKHGADYCAFDKNGVTPYHLSVLNKDTTVIKLFWSHFCPWDLPLPDESRRPLCLPEIKKAIENQESFISGILNNDIEIMGSALEDEAEVRGCSMKLPYPLHFVAAKGFDSAAHMLLCKGFPANRLNDKGETPLHLAASEGSYQVCIYLLMYGAMYNPASKFTGNTPMDLAVKNNHFSVNNILGEIDKLFCCNNEKTILNKIKRRAIKNQENFHSLLALINCVDRKGNTLMGKALHKGFYELAKYIMYIRLQMPEEF